MQKYALVINGQITKECFFPEAAVFKVRDGKPIYLPIVAVPVEYDALTHYHTVQRTLEDARVVDAWVVHPRAREDVNTALLASLAAHRYGVEVGGFDLGGGQRIQTDRESRPNLIGARITALEVQAWNAAGQPSDTGVDVDDFLDMLTNGITWKTATGFVTMPLAVVVPLADAVNRFVRQCFKAEKEVAAQVGDYNSVAEITGAFNSLMAA